VPTLTESTKTVAQSTNISYRQEYPSYSERIKRREENLTDLPKLEDSLSKAKNNSKKARGRRPKKFLVEQRRMLDHLRRQRRRKVTMMHTEVSEFELIQNVRVIIHIIRNLSFVKMNEHPLVK